MSGSAGVITWGLVIFGWIATHYLTLKREKRKEVRAKLDEIRKQLSDLELELSAFHMSENFSAEKARMLVLVMQRISRDIEREPKLKENTSRYRVELRKSATLENFDKTSFVRLEPDNPLMDKVAASHDNLVNRLEQNYITFYRDSFL